MLAERKSKPKDFQPYARDNGRVNRCADMMRAGKIRTGGVLLDVGGGIGDLCQEVRDLFETTIVLDISWQNLEAAKHKASRTICADVDKHGLTDLPNGAADVVTALDFIEHIVDPENFARECHRVLRPGGEVFINTPNIRFWRHIEALWRGGRFPHTSGDREVYHGGHLAFFTYSDLREIFEGAGFTGCVQLLDGEDYDPPDWEYIAPMKPRNQGEYKGLMAELGYPNLLFKAVRP